MSVCFVDDEDINAWMVARDWALAYRHYSHDYVAQEERAAKAKLGMWQGEFDPPWEWRAIRLLLAKTGRHVGGWL